MSIQFRLTVMNFMQFFVWGSWLISLGAYMIVTLGFTGGQVGSIYATMGIGSLFMPGLMGIVADRWVNAERVYGICHLVGAGLLLWASTVKDFDTLYVIMLLNAMVYMPTIALNNTVSYKVLEQKGLNVIQTFPPIRVWGTVGFIAAMWMVDFAGWTKSALQLYISAGAALFLGFYAFTMPKCPPAKCGRQAQPGRRRSGSTPSCCSGASRCSCSSSSRCCWARHCRSPTPSAARSWTISRPRIRAPSAWSTRTCCLSISQISETLFILTIPFFLQRFGIKKVMLISIFAWVFRFGLFAVGDPGAGLWMLVLSMIIYGMAFDFFNISGSLFVDREAEPAHPRERAGSLHDHDERPRRLRRRHGERLGRRSLHGERREGLAEHLADLRGLRARARHRLPAGVQLPARPGEDAGRRRPLISAVADTAAEGSGIRYSPQGDCFVLRPE